jgi:benzoylsuccinyl-CoA thiolase BbsB subunit
MDAYVLGIGHQAFGKFDKTPIALLGAQAVRNALDDAPDGTPVDEVWCGSVLSGMLIGQRVMREVGAHGMPIFNVENACSSSAAAFSLAVQRVESGACRSALVVGVEKLSDLGGGPLPLVEDDWEVRQRISMPAVYAMRAMRYMDEVGGSDSDLAAIAVKNHNNGAANPRAYWTREINADDVRASRMIADPLTLLQCCPSVDGASAVLVGREDFLDHVSPRVRVLASVVQSGQFTNSYRDMTRSELSERTASLAYEAAGIDAGRVDVAEVHDAFSIAELMYYEALGFAQRGEGPELVRNGVTARDGSLPVNPSGGLLARGHPIGATGTAQIAETTLQLRGDAGPVQVARQPTIGLTHCTGGGIWGFDHGACTVTLLERVS